MKNKTNSIISIKEKICLCALVLGCWTLSFLSLVFVPIIFTSIGTYGFIAWSAIFTIMGFTYMFHFEATKRKKSLYLMNILLGFGLFAGWIMLAWMKNLEPNEKML